MLTTSRSGFNLFLIGTALALLSTSVANRSYGSDDLDQVRTALDALWGSVHTVSFTSEEYNTDASGAADVAKGFSRTEIALGPRGRSRHKLTAVWPDHETVMNDFYEDGKTQFTVTHLKEHPDIVDMILTQPEKSKDDAYVGPMCNPLWILLPGGRRLNDIARGSVKLVGDPKDASSISLTFTFNGLNVVCKLAKTKDYLIEDLTLPDYFNTHITKFEKHDGRWRPLEGLTTNLKDGRKNLFRYTRFAYNEEPKSGYDPTKNATDGALIYNTVTHIGQPIGGAKQRAIFEERYLKPHVLPAHASHFHFGSRFITWSGIVMSATAFILLASAALILKGKLHSR